LSTFQEIRRDLTPFYSSIGRPSIDPELMMRMLLVGYASASDRSGASLDTAADVNLTSQLRSHEAMTPPLNPQSGVFYHPDHGSIIFKGAPGRGCN